MRSRYHGAKLAWQGERSTLKQVAAERAARVDALEAEKVELRDYYQERERVLRNALAKGDGSVAKLATDEENEALQEQLEAQAARLAALEAKEKDGWLSAVDRLEEQYQIFMASATMGQRDTLEMLFEQAKRWEDDDLKVRDGLAAEVSRLEEVLRQSERRCEKERQRATKYAQDGQHSEQARAQLDAQRLAVEAREEEAWAETARARAAVAPLEEEHARLAAEATRLARELELSTDREAEAARRVESIEFEQDAMRRRLVRHGLWQPRHGQMAVSVAPYFIWPPRAHQAASGGLRLPSAPVRSDPSPPVQPRGRVPVARSRPRRHLRCV